MFTNAVIQEDLAMPGTPQNRGKGCGCKGENATLIVQVR